MVASTLKKKSIIKSNKGIKHTLPSVTAVSVLDTSYAYANDSNDVSACNGTITAGDGEDFSNVADTHLLISSSGASDSDDDNTHSHTIITKDPTSIFTDHTTEYTSLTDANAAIKDIVKNENMKRKYQIRYVTAIGRNGIHIRCSHHGFYRRAKKITDIPYARKRNKTILTHKCNCSLHYMIKRQPPRIGPYKLVVICGNHSNHKINEFQVGSSVDIACLRKLNEEEGILVTQHLRAGLSPAASLKLINSSNPYVTVKDLYNYRASITTGYPYVNASELLSVSAQSEFEGTKDPL